MHRLALISLALVGGCTFNPVLPAGLDVTCQSTADCPASHVCDSSLLVCVSQKQHFLEQTLTPDRGRAGQRFEVRFRPDQRSLGPTLVRGVSRGDRSVVLTFAAVPSSGETQVFEYVADGTEPEGLYDVLIDLNLEGEGQFFKMRGGTFELDFTAPRARASIHYEVEAGNALSLAVRTDLVHAGKVGTRVRLEADFDEPVLSPKVVLGAGGERLAFALESATTLTHVVSSAVVTPSPLDPVEQTFSLALEVEDALGNRAASPVGEVSLDTLAPTQLLVDEPGLVVFHREPFGAEDAGPRYQVRASRVPGTLVTVFALGIPVANLDVDAGQVDERPFALPADPDTVELRAVDAAGNVSARVEVRDIEWTAWFGPGAVSSAALTTEARTVHTRALGLTGTRSQPVWPISITGSLPWELRSAFRPRGGGVAYQPLLAQELTDMPYGPDTAFSLRSLPCNTRSQFDGTDVVAPILRAPAPDGGFISATVTTLDATRDRWVAVFAEGTTVEFANQRQSDAGYPLIAAYPRTLPTVGGSALAWDHVSGRVMLVGGLFPDAGASADARWWTGSEWVDAPAGPPARDSAALEFDRDGQALLYGGTGRTDAWWYADGGWSPIDGGSAGPSMTRALLSHDLSRNRFFLTENPGNCTINASLWRFENSAWNRVPTMPAVSLGPVVAVPPETLWSAGVDTSAFTGDTWTRIGLGPSSVGGGVLARSGTGDITWFGGNSELKVWADGGFVTVDAGPTPGPDAGIQNLSASNTGYLLASPSAVWSFDSTRGYVLLPPLPPDTVWTTALEFGGLPTVIVQRGPATEILQLDGTSWRNLASAAYFRPMSAGVESDGGLVLMGTNLGVSPSQYFFEQSTAVRAFDGTHFVELLTTIPTGLALDPHFLAGVGFMSPGNLSVALLRLDSVDARPSFVAHAGLSAARIPDDAVLTSARLEALAGGQTPQAGTSGTRLLAWLDGRWVEGNDSSANAAPLDAPALMSVELTDRELRQATLYRRELGFAVETRGRSTLGQPVTMRVDWARASLRFRRRAP